jgi:D-galactarolactone cycloisomerase
MVDANHAYNTATAARMARGLESLGVRWFEEPVPPEDRDGYRAVRRASSVPIAGGECEYTRYGFRDLIAGGWVDIAQPDLCAAGGFSEWVKIAALAESFGVWVIPHVWGSGVALAAALHALAALPPFPHTANPIPLENEPVVDSTATPTPCATNCLNSPSGAVRTGACACPMGPAWGSGSTAVSFGGMPN